MSGLVRYKVVFSKRLLGRVRNMINMGVCNWRDERQWNLFKSVFSRNVCAYRFVYLNFWIINIKVAVTNSLVYLSSVTFYCYLVDRMFGTKISILRVSYFNDGFSFCLLLKSDTKRNVRISQRLNLHFFSHPRMHVSHGSVKHCHSALMLLH